MFRLERDDRLRIVVYRGQHIDEAKQHKQHDLVTTKVTTMRQQLFDFHIFAQPQK